ARTCLVSYVPLTLLRPLRSTLFPYTTLFRSWGNAGFLTPDIATPLPEPAVLRYGLKALVSPRSPLYVPIGFDPQLWNFLLRFATHCTSRAWRANGKRLATLNRQSLEAFAEIDAAIQQAGDASPETPVAESGPFPDCFT